MAEHDEPTRELDRRTFLRESARHGAALAGLALAPGLVARAARAAQESSTAGVQEPVVPSPPPDISVASGPDPFQSTVAAIDQLGGISRFVSRGDRVALLMNTWSEKPGTYTKPAIALAIGHLCYEAGAKQVVLLKDEDEDYWRLEPNQQKHAALIARLGPAKSGHRDVEVRGQALEEASYLEAALDFERLINLPIVKHHSGCRMTGCLKNMMGLTSTGTNMGFHLGNSPVSTFLSNIGNSFPVPDHFGQCVADLYGIRKPDLLVLDATEIITTNGPSGPGKLLRPGEVLAGTDPVAMDALGCAHLDIDPADVFILRKAHESGLGQIDPSQRRVQRTALG